MTIVIRMMAMLIVFCSTSAAPVRGAQSGGLPNPAIVRIISPESDGASYGTGALVAVNDTYGLVITNWHVIRDAAAPILVAFPNGFQSAATVLKTDRDWDLAALAVWRPNVAPIPLAAQAPRPGEQLTIAGYGSGWFRTASGQCTQYVSPGENHPFEMVELAAPARNGDSGGPILNDRGEIAGVLFGSAYGRTTGSYCGRLRWFLSSVDDNFQRLPAQPAAIAQRQTTSFVPAAIDAQPSSSLPATDSAPSSSSKQNLPPSIASVKKQPPALTAISAKLPAASIQNRSSTASISPFEQMRNYLAIVGILAILMQGLQAARKLAG
jgi:serine protease Do